VGTNLVIMSHIDIISPTLVNRDGDSSPTFVHHVGYEPPASAIQVESMFLVIVSNVGGIHTI
jgi:hypothetical protein